MWVAIAEAKRGRVDPELVARWQEDVVEAIAVGRLDDVAAMVPRALQLGVRDAEELVVVVAQGAEPADFHGGAHGSGTPSLSWTMR